MYWGGGGDVCMGDLLVGGAQICTNVMGGEGGIYICTKQIPKIKKIKS